jgi:hypothetical protein
MSVKNITDSPAAPLAVASGDWFGTWELEANKPATYLSVLVCGILVGEHERDCHEGYWDGKRWWSVRRDELDASLKLELKYVTHWTPRPIVPNVELKHGDETKQ